MITVDKVPLGLQATDLGLLTDLYQLTMAACYVGEGIADKPASFELFVRHLPENYGYLIAMGLEEALTYLETLRFTPDHIQALQQTGLFDQAPAEFWSRLAALNFTGTVWAVPPGTAIFANEPLLRVEAPLWQAQLVETFLLNTINYQTLIATRAARLRDVAGDRATLLEFGTRRAFSPQGAVWAAKAALAGGLNATSNVLAALQLGEKPSGTMAHALVMAIAALSGSEDEAFAAFQQYFPSAPLLIDTFDTVKAAQRLAARVHHQQMTVTGVRLDSGDLAQLSQQVRALLPDITIFASGDLDEWAIADLQQRGASIDGYGLGTKLVTGTPVNGVYKLVEIDGQPTCKRSSHKATYPGKKQIFRQYTEQGQWIGDRLGLATEAPESGETPLLTCVMTNGKRQYDPESLPTLRQRTRASVQALPATLRQLNAPPSAPVDISPALQDLQKQLFAQPIS